MEITEENSGKIWKLWKKDKLNNEKIWKMQKKIIKWYGKYGWNVKWYGKYGRKGSWIVKRYGKCKETYVEYWKDRENIQERSAK